MPDGEGNILQHAGVVVVLGDVFQLDGGRFVRMVAVVVHQRMVRRMRVMKKLEMKTRIIELTTA